MDLRLGSYAGPLGGGRFLMSEVPLQPSDSDSGQTSTLDLRQSSTEMMNRTVRRDTAALSPAIAQTDEDLLGGVRGFRWPSLP